MLKIPLKRKLEELREPTDSIVLANVHGYLNCAGEECPSQVPGWILPPTHGK